MEHKPDDIIKPSGMEIIFTYRCPKCQRDVPVLATTTPTRIRCDNSKCGHIFPIMPVDERTIRYMKIMTANGTAAIDPDFM